MPTYRVARISIVNRSSLLADAACRQIAQACQLQLREHVAPAWGRVPPIVDFVPRGGRPPGDALPVYVEDDPDTNATFGHHAEDTNGRPEGRVFVRPILTHGGGVLAGDLSVASVVSHEAVESFIDPSCQLWSQRADGVLVAYEACDPVHGQSYLVAPDGLVTGVCDFVLPAWFDSDASRHGTRYDWLDTLGAPFGLGPHGYVITLSRGELSEVVAPGALVAGVRAARGGLRSVRRRRHL